jgi:predicted phosphodiesterase
MRKKGEVVQGLTKSNIARQYRDKYGMEMPTKKLARIMYGENKLLFTDVEHARTILRAIEGKGKGIRILATHPAPNRPLNPYKLPESDEETFEHFYIKGFKTGLIINDLHIPYHNQLAITACFDYAKKRNPDFIFINGDINDFHSVSYFQKDPRKKRFSEEIEMACDFLRLLKSIFKCKIFLKFGNHEERYDNFLFQKAHELKGLDEFELENIYKSRVPDIEIIRDKRLVIINGLPFIHGHEFGRAIFSPVNAARGLILRAKHSAVKGDCHTTSEHATKDILGKIMTTFSVGCLCGLTPKWLPLNDWNQGFAMIYLNENGEDYEFRNYRIYNGKVL